MYGKISTLLFLMLLVACSNDFPRMNDPLRHSYLSQGYLEAYPSGVLLYDNEEALINEQLDKCFDLDVDIETYRSLRQLANGAKIEVNGYLDTPVPRFSDDTSVHVLKRKNRMSSLVCSRRQNFVVLRWRLVDSSTSATGPNNWRQ